MELLKYEEARAALAACVKIDEARNIRDTAEAIRAYARQANDTEIESRAAEIKLRALRRLGELSREMPRAKPGGTINGKKGGAKIDCPGGGQSKNDALADAGITRQQANRCEIIASLPEEHFEAKINAAKALGRPLRIPDVDAKRKSIAKKESRPRISPPSRLSPRSTAARRPLPTAASVSRPSPVCLATPRVWPENASAPSAVCTLRATGTPRACR